MSLFRSSLWELEIKQLRKDEIKEDTESWLNIMEAESGHLDFIDIFMGSKRDKREEEKRLKENVFQEIGGGRRAREEIQWAEEKCEACAQRRNEDVGDAKKGKKSKVKKNENEKKTETKNGSKEEDIKSWLNTMEASSDVGLDFFEWMFIGSERDKREEEKRLKENVFQEIGAGRRAREEIQWAEEKCEAYAQRRKEDVGDAKKDKKSKVKKNENEEKTETKNGSKEEDIKSWLNTVEASNDVGLDFFEWMFIGSERDKREEEKRLKENVFQEIEAGRRAREEIQWAEEKCEACAQRRKEDVGDAKKGKKSKKKKNENEEKTETKNRSKEEDIEESWRNMVEATSGQLCFFEWPFIGNERDKRKEEKKLKEGFLTEQVDWKNGGRGKIIGENKLVKKEWRNEVADEEVAMKERSEEEFENERDVEEGSEVVAICKRGKKGKGEKKRRIKKKKKKNMEKREKRRNKRRKKSNF